MPVGGEPGRQSQHCGRPRWSVMRTNVGLDVHARSVVACGIDDVTGELFKARLVPDPAVIFGWLGQLPPLVAACTRPGRPGSG